MKLFNIRSALVLFALITALCNPALADEDEDQAWRKLLNPSAYGEDQAKQAFLFLIKKYAIRTPADVADELKNKMVGDARRLWRAAQEFYRAPRGSAGRGPSPRTDEPQESWWRDPRQYYRANRGSAGSGPSPRTDEPQPSSAWRNAVDKGGGDVIKTLSDYVSEIETHARVGAPIMPKEEVEAISDFVSRNWDSVISQPYQRRVDFLRVMETLRSHDSTAQESPSWMELARREVMVADRLIEGANSRAVGSHYTLEHEGMLDSVRTLLTRGEPEQIRTRLLEAFRKYDALAASKGMPDKAGKLIEDLLSGHPVTHDFLERKGASALIDAAHAYYGDSAEAAAKLRIISDRSEAVRDHIVQEAARRGLFAVIDEDRRINELEKLSLRAARARDSFHVPGDLFSKFLAFSEKGSLDEIDAFMKSGAKNITPDQLQDLLNRFKRFMSYSKQDGLGDGYSTKRVELLVAMAYLHKNLLKDHPEVSEKLRSLLSENIGQELNNTELRDKNPSLFRHLVQARLGTYRVSEDSEGIKSGKVPFATRLLSSLGFNDVGLLKKLLDPEDTVGRRLLFPPEGLAESRVRAQRSGDAWEALLPLSDSPTRQEVQNRADVFTRFSQMLLDAGQKDLAEDAYKHVVGLLSRQPHMIVEGLDRLGRNFKPGILGTLGKIFRTGSGGAAGCLMLASLFSGMP